MSQILELRGSDGGQQLVGSVAVTPDALASVACSLAALECEIAGLWRDTIDSRDAAWSERLVELSHAVRRATAVLEAEPLIGLPLLGSVAPARSWFSSNQRTTATVATTISTAVTARDRSLR